MSDRKLAIEAWESLFRAQYELLSEMSSDFQNSAITQAEYDVLLTVTRCQDATARLRDVTANMLISQPSVSRLVDRMVVRGYIEKLPDPEDGRGSLLRATDQGKEIFRSVAIVHGRSIVDRMAPLNPDELRTLLALTTKLRQR